MEKKIKESIRQKKRIFASLPAKDLLISIYDTEYLAPFIEDLLQVSPHTKIHAPDGTWNHIFNILGEERSRYSLKRVHNSIFQYYLRHAQINMVIIQADPLDYLENNPVNLEAFQYVFDADILRVLSQVSESWSDKLFLCPNIRVDYQALIAALKENCVTISLEMRLEAFHDTIEYISNYFRQTEEFIKGAKFEDLLKHFDVFEHRIG